MEKLLFVEVLLNRLAPDKVLFFLKVCARGVEFPLGNSEYLSQRVLVVPDMILAVIEEKEDKFRVKWHGPTFQCDSNRSREKPRYSEDIAFYIDVPKSALNEGQVEKISPRRIIKMKHHVPAVLFNAR